MVNVDELHVGSLVRLASGSPKMAVVSVTRDDDPSIWLVNVTWYSEPRGIETATFAPELLAWPRNGPLPAPAESGEPAE